MARTGGASFFYPQVRPYGTVGVDELARRMARSGTFSVGEITGIQRDFPEFIIDALLQGNSVAIDGLGTFRLKADGTAHEDGGDITTEGIRVSVVFTPDPRLSDRLLREAEFTFEK